MAWPSTFVAGNPLTASQMNGIQAIGAAWTVDARASSVVWNASTTDPVLGNGTMVARQLQIGKTYGWEVRITMGSTTTFGTGEWRLIPPNATSFTYCISGHLRGYDVSASTTLGYSLDYDLASATTISLRCPPTTQPNADRQVTSALPFTWATGDILAGMFWLEGS